MAAAQQRVREQSPNGAPNCLNANGLDALAVIAPCEVLDGDGNLPHREQIFAHIILSASSARSSRDETTFLVSQTGDS